MTLVNRRRLAGAPLQNHPGPGRMAESGIRDGLKNHCPKGIEGSNPSAATYIKEKHDAVC